MVVAEARRVERGTPYLLAWLPANPEAPSAAWRRGTLFLARRRQPGDWWASWPGFRWVMVGLAIPLRKGGGAELGPDLRRCRSLRQVQHILRQTANWSPKRRLILTWQPAAPAYAPAGRLGTTASPGAARRLQARQAARGARGEGPWAVAVEEAPQAEAPLGSIAI